MSWRQKPARFVLLFTVSVASAPWNTKGQTEPLLSCSGKSADKTKQSLVCCPESMAFFCGEKNLHVRRTRKYTHLGTVLPDTATAGPDL